MGIIWKCKCGWIGTNLFTQTLDNGCASDGLPCYVDDSRCPNCMGYPEEAEETDVLEYLSESKITNI